MTLLMPDPQFVARRMQKKFREKNHDMAVVVAMAEGAVYKGDSRCTKTLSKAPCLVALRMYLTLHLLLFAQSM